MEKEQIEQEIEALNNEYKELKEEYEVLEGFFKKNMDNDKYKDFMLQKKEMEKFMKEIEVELDMLNKLKESKQ